MKENVLYLTRFCGVERYPVITAEWYIIEGDGTEDVNYYDGSKPKNTMELVAWFDKN